MNPEIVKKIARLAGLRLNESELATAQIDFEKLLEHFSSLNEIDLSNTEPLYHLVNENHFRNDGNEPETIPRKALLGNAPDHDESHFRLGRILGGAE